MPFFEGFVFLVLLLFSTVQSASLPIQTGERNQSRHLACKEGQWGKNCELRCPNFCKTCNQTTGECTGCPTGAHGKYCHQPCPATCVNLQCNRVSGHCVHGCNTGFHGDTCQHTCPKGCPESCDWITGVCFRCKNGKYGAKCDKLKDSLSNVADERNIEAPKMDFIALNTDDKVQADDTNKGASTDGGSQESSTMDLVTQFFLGYIIGGVIISALALIAFAACRKKLKHTDTHFLMLTNPEFTIYDGRPMTEAQRKELDLKMAAKHRKDSLGQSSYTQTNKRAVAFDEDETNQQKTDPMCTVCGQQMCVTCGKRMNADHVSHSPGAPGQQNADQLGKDGKVSGDKTDGLMAPDANKKQSGVSFKGLDDQKDGSEYQAGHTQSEHDGVGGKDDERAGPSVSKSGSRKLSSRRSLKGLFKHGSKHKDSDRTSIQSQPVAMLAVAQREDGRSLQSLPAGGAKPGKQKGRPWKNKRGKKGDWDGSDVDATGRNDSDDLTCPETTDSGGVNHDLNDEVAGKRRGTRPRGRRIRYRTICEACKTCGCGGCVVFDVD